MARIGRSGAKSSVVMGGRVPSPHCTGTLPKEDLGLGTKLAKQHFLADRREVDTGRVEHVTDAQAA